MYINTKKKDIGIYRQKLKTIIMEHSSLTLSYKQYDLINNIIDSLVTKESIAEHKNIKYYIDKINEQYAPMLQRLADEGKERADSNEKY